MAAANSADSDLQALREQIDKLLEEHNEALQVVPLQNMTFDERQKHERRRRAIFDLILELKRRTSQ